MNYYITIFLLFKLNRLLTILQVFFIVFSMANYEQQENKSNNNYNNNYYNNKEQQLRLKNNNINEQKLQLNNNNNYNNKNNSYNNNNNQNNNIDLKTTTMFPLFKSILLINYYLTTTSKINKTACHIFLGPLFKQINKNAINNNNNYNINKIQFSEKTIEIDSSLILLNSKLKTIKTQTLFKTHPISAIVICLLVSISICITIIGNLMVCCAVLIVRKLKQQPANLLIVSLATVDFSVGLLVMPIALLNIIEERWVLSKLNFNKLFYYLRKF